MNVRTCVQGYISHTVKFALLFPASTLAMKVLNLSQFIPQQQTLSNPAIWSETLLQTFQTFQFGAGELYPLSEANAETALAALTIGVVTATIFQTLRRIPRLRDHSLTTFCISLASTGLAATTISPSALRTTLEVCSSLALTTAAIRVTIPVLKFFDLPRSITTIDHDTSEVGKRNQPKMPLDDDSSSTQELTSCPDLNNSVLKQLLQVTEEINKGVQKLSNEGHNPTKQPQGSEQSKRPKLFYVSDNDCSESLSGSG